MAITTVKKSGYLAAESSVAGTVLNSITDNTWSALTDEIDNSSNQYYLSDLELVLGSASYVTPGDCGIEVYAVPTVDGTNYPTWTSGTTADRPENTPYFVGYFTLTGTTAAQRAVISAVELPSGKFKFGFRNRANVTLPSSGNTVKMRPHSYVGDTP
jgi:hypothetical protein